MTKPKRAPTLSDVAERAGVSPFTASVVLNGSRSNTRVSESTRQRILEVAAELRYHPNAMARGLVHRRMNTVGVLFSVMDSSAVVTNPYGSTILQGILMAAEKAGYNVTIFTETWRSAEQSAVRFRDGRTDGILVIAPVTDSDMMPGLAALGLPLVAIAYPAESYSAPCVDVDNARGIRLAVEHLLSLGHRRIAHLTGNPNMGSVPVRREAFCQVLAEAGIPILPEYIVTCRYDGLMTRESVAHLLALPEPPTAIVAGNDAIAIEAMAAARERGVAVPEQLSIVGFDDTPSATLVTPALTTVRQPLLEIGGMATRLLVAQIEGKTVPPTAHLLEPELVVRASTASNDVR
ncbi:MAG TPA: LacI family DNA-binding transcriptional regulator [Chthonomonadaceae bacterium]|nr:LacI family DNA-binding transcriptional regulator [Chthonomonadaceae bacterium]